MINETVVLIKKSRWNSSTSANEHAPVDAKGDKTHDGKLEELLGKRLCCQLPAHVITSNVLMNRAEDTLELLQGKRKVFCQELYELAKFSRAIRNVENLPGE